LFALKIEKLELQKIVIAGRIFRQGPVIRRELFSRNFGWPPN
jgi:hypothetical protein